MKITLHLISCLLLSSASLLAKPLVSTYSTPDDSLCIEIPETIEEDAPSLAPTVVVIGDFCGQGTGSIDLTPDPGTPGPWTYQWSTGATTQDLSGLTAGTYTVFVTDANGNAQAAQIVVPDLPPASPTGVNAVPTGNTSCTAPFNGALDITVIPAAPWTYQWSNGATTQDVTGLNSGTHTVTITMGVTCSTTYQFTVPDLAGVPNAFIPPPGHSPSTCERSDGATGVLVSGGVQPYSYLWSNGATTIGNQNIPAGTYTVTVTGANGCTSTASVVVTNVNYNMDIESVALTPNTTCIGSNGAIDLVTVAPIIWEPTFTYMWSNGATTQDLVNVPSGSYWVTVSINAACFVTGVYYIEHEPALPELVFNNTNATCSMNNGFVNLTTLPGGTPPFTYLWSNGATTQDLANVPAGNYDVTITGNNGCPLTATAFVDDTEVQFSYSALVTDNTACDTTNGQIALSLFPGNLAFQWSNGATTKTIKNLAPGDYTVTVSAGGTCTAVETFTVGDVQSYPSIPAVVDTATCGLANGNIDLFVFGDPVLPLTYQWSNGATAQDLTGLAADTFYVTVTSAVGCSAQNTVIVPNVNDTIRVLANVVDNVSCSAPTGAISLDIQPIDSSYTILWSNGQMTDSLAGLDAGDYLVTVTLGLTCIAQDTFSVANLALPPNLAIAGQPALCGLANGSADLNVASGVAPFTVLWSTMETSEDLANLTPGAYSVTVTGANDCSAVSTVNIQNTNISLNVNAAPLGNSSCVGANGAIDLSVAPAGNYSYLWSNASTDEDINNLGAGTFTVTVSLGNCQSTGTFTVPDITAAPVLSPNITASVCGLDNGSIDLGISGPAGPYTYLWSNAANTEDLNNLLPGAYSVTVTTQNGCTASATYNVANNAATLNLSATPVPLTDCVAGNGAIDLSVAPAGVYTYLWSNSATNEDIANLQAGSFTVTVSWGTCQATASYSVADNTASPVLSPDITASICSVDNGAIDLSVSGPAGPYTYLWSNAATTEDLNNLLPGNYSVTVTAPNSCSVVQTFNVPNNASNFSLSGTAAPLTNCAADNGAVDLNITPAGAYTYLWSNAATTQDLSGLPPGTYTVSVTDPGSCTATASYFVVDQRTNPTASQAVVAELCGLSDGSIDLTVSSGTAPFDYLWASGQATQDLANIPAGTYTVTVTDANNCTVTATATVPGNSITFSLAGTPSPHSNCLQNNGAIDLSVNPASPNYTYLWSGGQNSEDLSNIAAGTYTVTVSAGGNCTATAAFVVASNLPFPQISQSIVSAFCGQQSGNIDLSVNGSPAPYTYLWSNGITNEDLANIASGNYTVTVTGANGCSSTANFSVPEDTFSPAIQSALTPASSCTIDNGAIDLTVTPTENYTFLWSNAATTEDLANLPTGTYTVTVSAGGACSSTAVLTVSSNAPMPMLSSNIMEATCGQASGSIDLNVAASPGPYQFLWSNAATTEDLSNTVSGQFTVTVTAANGCSATASFTVPENVILPQINSVLTADNSCIADNGAIDLTAGPASGYAFLWSNAATTQDLTNLPAGTYSVTVNGGGACTATASFVIGDQTTQPQAQIAASVITLDCITDSAILSANVTGTTNPVSFQWTNNGVPLGSGNSLAVTNPGQFDLLVVDDVTSCTATASIAIGQNIDPPALLVGMPALLTCAAPSQTLVGSSLVSGVQFAWASIIGTDTTFLGNGATLSISAPGTYYLFGLNPANNCANATTAIVSADQAPPMADAGAPFTLDCAGETTSLNGSGTGAANLNFQWTSQDGHFVSSASLPNPLIDQAGTYVLLVTNPANGCTDSDEVIILPEVPVAYASATQPLCFGDFGAILVDSVTGLSDPIVYSLNNNIPSAQNQFANLAPGNYTLLVEGDNGCSATAVVAIEQPDELEITLTPEVEIKLGHQFQIDAGVNIPADEIASVSWTPSTGLECDTCLSTLAMPFVTTTYELVVTSKDGCEARSELILKVDNTRKIFAPNIFSPNDDGENDVFVVFADPLTVVNIESLQVYSRWGEAVFEWRDFAPGDEGSGWDGTFRGQKLNPGVFVWQALVRFVDGKEEFFFGDVTLMR